MRRCLAIGALALGAMVVPFAPALATAPDDTSPDDTSPDDTTPDDTTPDDTTPDDTIPDEQVSGDIGVVTGGTGGGESTPVTVPLVPVPAGCTAPTMPYVVFTGSPVERDFRTARFEVDQVRAGRLEPFADDGLIDVRYGLDVQYLVDGDRYLVSAVVDPDLGLLVSSVTDPIENFGGDEVIGVSETDIDCPIVENAARTLHPDGTPIETSLLEPFFSARLRLLGALLIPFGVALAMIFALAAVRLSVSGLFRSVVGVGRR